MALGVGMGARVGIGVDLGWAGRPARRSIADVSTMQRSDSGNEPTALSPEGLRQIQEFVVPLVRDLGRWAQEQSIKHYRGEHNVEVSRKTGPGDVVTAVDHEVQRRLVAALQPRFPGFGFLGEEGLSDYDPAAPTWVIDPIDGTHNFVRAYPGFAVSVGLVVGGESVLGVIYDAATDSVTKAAKGQGAWREGADGTATRLHVAAAKPLTHALLTTGFTTESANTPFHQRAFVALAGGSAGMRQSGSACRDLVHVAAGLVDAYWQFGVRAWDVAAGLVIVREAGGVAYLSDVPGASGNAAAWLRAPGMGIIAGEKQVVEEALAVVGACREG